VNFGQLSRKIVSLTFSGDYISAPTGCWPLTFLLALDTGQGLLAQTANRFGVPKNFTGEKFKIGLKITHMRAWFWGSGY